MKVLTWSLLSLFICAASRAEWFLHRATDDNINGNTVNLPRHLTDDAAQKVFAGPLRFGYFPSHLNRNIGLWYTGANWSVYNEVPAFSFQPDSHWACYIAEGTDTAFTHVHVAASQSVFKRSYLDHSALNGQPDAILTLAHNWSVNYVYNNQYSFVDYNTTLGRWYIYGYIPNDEFTDIPPNAAWNILVHAPGTNAYIHTATAGTITDDRSELDHPYLNNNPNALVLVTPEYAPSGIGMQFAPTEVEYDSVTGRWNLDALDDTPFRENARFHLFVAPGPNTSEPVLDITSTNRSQVMVNLGTEFGYTYQLQTSPTFGLWQDEGLPFEGNGETIHYPTTVVLSNNNYRVERAYSDL